MAPLIDGSYSIPVVTQAHAVGSRPAWSEERGGLFLAQVIHPVVGELVGHILHEAFDEGLLYWENLLSSKVGLEIRASDERDIWKHLCDRFCLSPFLRANSRIGACRIDQ